MNTPLFESLINKLETYPDMKSSLYNMLVNGQKLSYNPDNEATKLLLMFGFVKVADNGVVIANRIFETRLYNYLNFEKGYLLTFSFNKNKESGVKTTLFEGKTIVEAVV